MRADGELHAEHSRCWQNGIYTYEDLVTDHIVPMSKGGAQYDRQNLETLCRSCNTAKDN
jgi:5-methylcytosine-specific restriction endonuclease McrA